MKKFIAIRFKIFILLNILVLFILFTKFLISVNFLEEHSKTNFESNNNTINEFLSRNIKESLYTNNIDAASEMLQSIKSHNIKNIYIFNNMLALLTQQNNIGIDIVDLKTFIKTYKDGLISYNDTSYYLTTFSIIDIPMAYMIISINQEELNHIIEDKKEALYIEALMFLLFALIFVYFLSVFITRPIEKIVSKLKETQASSTLNLDIHSHDEFKFLANSIENNHNKLKELNLSLEKEVQKKTLELQELNQNLENRVINEITKNKNKDKLMLHQSRLAQMGEMLSMIAHQWRQPLSAISASSTKLLIKTTLNKYDPTLYKDKLEDIIQYTQHLSTTIDDFREFFKSNKEEKEIEIQELLESIKNIIMPALESKNIALSTIYHYDGVVSTYPNEVKQVILNLIKNAEDIFLDGKISEPSIIITTCKTEDSIQIDVKDNAGGISDNILLNIFEPYFTTKGKSDGTGLGLYMSQTIIEKHCKGKLLVKNEEGGAVFSILLPQPKYILEN